MNFRLSKARKQRRKEYDQKVLGVVASIWKMIWKLQILNAMKMIMWSGRGDC